jgi:hypothetical protein
VNRAREAQPWEAVFRSWAENYAADAHARKPHIRPFPVDAFDGCTGGLDVAPMCCFMHDVAYWFAETPEEQAEADAALRACVAACGVREGWLNRQRWKLRAWFWWAVVRWQGSRFIAERRAAWEAAR